MAIVVSWRADRFTVARIKIKLRVARTSDSAALLDPDIIFDCDACLATELNRTSIVHCEGVECVRVWLALPRGVPGRHEFQSATIEDMDVL